MADPQEPQEGWEYSDHTAAVIEAARKVLPNFRVGAYEEGGVTYTKVEIRMNGRWYVWEGRFDDAVAWAEDGLFATLQAQANAIEAYDEAETESDILSHESEG